MLEVDDEDFGEEQKPLLEELEIDFKDIWMKAKCVMIPSRSNRELLSTQADFWGPLFVVLSYAFLLLWTHLKAVSWIITLWVVGSLLVSVLYRLLGAQNSFSRTLGIIGYSLVPLVITALLLLLLGGVPGLALVLKLAGTFWAAYAAGSILTADAPELERKRPLLIYPVFLLYWYFMSLHGGA